MTTAAIKRIRTISPVSLEVVLGRAIYGPCITAFSPVAAGTVGFDLNRSPALPAMVLGPMFLAVVELLAKLHDLPFWQTFEPLQATLNLISSRVPAINTQTNVQCRVDDVLYHPRLTQHAVVQVYTEVRQGPQMVAQATMDYFFNDANIGGSGPWIPRERSRRAREFRPSFEITIDKRSVGLWVDLVFGPLPSMVELAKSRVPLALLFARVLEACVRDRCHGDPSRFRSLQMDILQPAAQDRPLEVCIENRTDTEANVTVIDPARQADQTVIAAATFGFDDRNSR